VLTGGQMTLADIPGLIEGAHLNRGLGHAFLRHIERSAALCYVLSLEPGGESLWRQLQCLRSELRKYSPALPDRATLVVANKSCAAPVHPCTPAPLTRPSQ
jgi:GTP-binding protein